MRKILFLAVFLALVTMAVLWTTRTGGTWSRLPADTTSGVAEVGGHFTLIDQAEREVKDADFRGRVMLVFFGFTRCPDICPVTVKTLSEVMDTLKDKADQVAPIFITVDPSHDRPGVLRDYLLNFNSHLIGLTGTAEQIRDVASAYKAYYSEADKPMEEASHEEEHEGAHEHGEGDTAQVNHSGLIYLMGRDGQYIRHFSYDASQTEILDALKPYLQ